MKFDMVAPPEGTDDNAAFGPPRHLLADEHLQDQAFPGDRQGESGVRPVGRRMAKAVVGVRTSLDLLRAHVIEQSMAKVHQATSDRTEVDPDAVFHPHRFSASPRKEDR